LSDLNATRTVGASHEALTLSGVVLEFVIVSLDALSGHILNLILIVVVVVLINVLGLGLASDPFDHACAITWQELGGALALLEVHDAAVELSQRRFGRLPSIPTDDLVLIVAGRALLASNQMLILSLEVLNRLVSLLRVKARSGTHLHLGCVLLNHIVVLSWLNVEFLDFAGHASTDLVFLLDHGWASGHLNRLRRSRLLNLLGLLGRLLLLDLLDDVVALLDLPLIFVALALLLSSVRLISQSALLQIIVNDLLNTLVTLPVLFLMPAKLLSLSLFLGLLVSSFLLDSKSLLLLPLLLKPCKLLLLLLVLNERFVFFLALELLSFARSLTILLHLFFFLLELKFLGGSFGLSLVVSDALRLKLLPRSFLTLLHLQLNFFVALLRHHLDWLIRLFLCELALGLVILLRRL